MGRGRRLPVRIIQRRTKRIKRRIRPWEHRQAIRRKISRGPPHYTDKLIVGRERRVTVHHRGAQMLTISPAAFISLFCFALLAIVIVQGPLGLAQAFTGQDMNVQAESTNARNTGQRPGVGQVQALLDILQLHPPSRPSASTGGEQPRIGGQHQAVGPNGAASSSWFIHQGESTMTNAMRNTANSPICVALRCSSGGGC